MKINIAERNNVTVIGKGEQVLLFGHGFGCDQTLWHSLTTYLEEAYKIILFDYVGAGKSDILAYDSIKYNSLDGYAQDVIDVIEAYQLENVIFIGHSVSSMIGMLAAIKRPQYFSKLIMIGPSPCYLNEGSYTGGFSRNEIEELLETMEMNFEGWASYMAPLAMDQSSDSILTKTLERTFVSTNPSIARQFAEVTFFSDYRQRLGELQLPTLILQCANDSIVPIEVGDYLNEHILDSELVILNTRGHYPHLSAPNLTAEIILQYLKRG
ncbi:alpha/beta fold hydrolase [Solibacillus merdavium]|uniref:Alpha/beta hydrolase n=1 Tax=Solibacillus merdavium TaxID=2762218 RepID=A0ABR8XS94_9BACL|nr:alpha/beta hydrolase [Solibacillus merdavium]MBD8034804.1 alpha/beta hydrolase [Solibacillus merdavium]